MATLLAKMTVKKLVHPFQLIVALSRVGEESVVAASFAVSRLERFSCSLASPSRLSREAELCVLSEAIRGAMHDQDRRFELRSAIPGSERVARGMENGGLQGPPGGTGGVAPAPRECPTSGADRARPGARASPAPRRRRTVRLLNSHRPQRRNPGHGIGGVTSFAPAPPPPEDQHAARR